jgi:hypothetical protein
MGPWSTTTPANAVTGLSARERADVESRSKSTSFFLYVSRFAFHTWYWWEIYGCALVEAAGIEL